MHGQTSNRPTRFASALIALGAAVLMTACQDSVGPSRQRTAAPTRAALAIYQSSKTFTYVPSKEITASIGDHRVTLAAWGVCDPDVSTYGPGTWDDPCTVLARPIDITATTYLDATGHPFVVFQPALRFVPGRVSTLYLKDKRATLDVFAKIVYCDDSGTSCVDESLTDPTLQTFRDKDIFFRRIKHFSGYNVAAGEDEGRDPLAVIEF
jgi:hypothetical protein